MAGTAFKAVIFVVSLVIGIGITKLATDLIPWMDDQMKIVAGIIVTLATFTSLYFLTKSSS